MKCNFIFKAALILCLVINSNITLAADVSNIQDIVTNLQKQIQQVADSVPHQLSLQNQKTQKSLSDMQKNVQGQLNTLQKQMEKLQADVYLQLKRIEQQIQQLSIMR